MAGADFFSQKSLEISFVQEMIKKRLFSLHLVFRIVFRRLQTQLSPTEAGLKSTFNVALKQLDSVQSDQPLEQPLPMTL
ncbi:hypothetical protein CES87_07450 [Pseudomonas sp. ERMR1:02]|nr:hypothetical protein CES87_07450 [Pseudomonas sp. ERMR1:02]